MTNANPKNPSPRLNTNKNIQNNTDDLQIFFSGSNMKTLFLRQQAVIQSWGDAASLSDVYLEQFSIQGDREEVEDDGKEEFQENSLCKAFWKRLKSAIDSQSSSVWFDRVQVTGVHGGTITLRTPSRPSLSEEQKKIAQDAARTVFGGFVQIVFEVHERNAFSLATSQDGQDGANEDYKEYTESLKNSLRHKVDENVFYSWFSSIQLDHLENETARLSVPVKFIRNWLQEHYADEILKALEEVFQNIHNFELVVRQVKDNFISDFSEQDRKILQAVNEGMADWESLIDLHPELFKSHYSNRNYDFAKVLLNDRPRDNKLGRDIEVLERRIEFIAERVQEHCLEIVEIIGAIKWFDPAKRYGFIVPDNGLPDVLLHVTCIRNSGYKRVLEGTRVHCQAVQRRRGLEVFRILSMDESVSISPSSLSIRTGVTVSPESDWERVTVKWFNRVTGRGFLVRGNNQPDIPVHIAILRHSGLAELRPGDVLEMQWGDGPKGICAAELRPCSLEPRSEHVRQG